MSQSTIEQPLHQAQQLHQAGRLEDAEALLQQILSADPNNVTARQTIGYIRFQQGRNEEALALIGAALAIDPDHAVSLVNYGIVLQAMKRLDEALASFDKALAVRPDFAVAYNNRGNVLRDLGRMDEALTSFESTLAISPQHFGALNNRGSTLRDMGRLEEALANFDKALSIHPGFAIALNNRGDTLRDLGRREEALESFEKAIELNPAFQAALASRGNTLRELGLPEAAMASYDRALAIIPDDPQTLLSRAMALRDLKRPQDAVTNLRRAVQVDPKFAEGWTGLGGTLRAMKDMAGAEATYRQALALKPDAPEMANNLALCLIDMDRSAEAMTLLQQTLDAGHGDATTWQLLGTLFLSQHKVDDAAAAAAKGIARDPVNPDLINLVGCVAFERGELDAAEAQFRRALELNSNFPDALNNLGNVLSDLGKEDDARAAYEKALALAPGMTNVYLAYADITRFTPGNPYLAAMEALREGAVPLNDTGRMQLDFALAKAYDDLKEPQRSFQRLLTGNAIKRSQIQYDEGEVVDFFDRIAEIFTPELLRAKEKLQGGDPSLVPVFVLGMPRSGTTLVEQILSSHPKVFGAGERETFKDAAGDFPGDVPGLDKAAIGRIGARYLAAMTKLSPTAARIVDKMPGNYYYLGLIHLALPGAKIIHTVRDPLDTCISCFSKLFSGQQNFSYDLAELGRYFRLYQKMMAHWHKVLPRGRILDVVYEELVADVEKEARRIVAHCGLDWDARCLSFHDTDRVVRTASSSQVRQPIYQSAVGRAEAYGEYLTRLKTALAGA